MTRRYLFLKIAHYGTSQNGSRRMRKFFAFLIVPLAFPELFALPVDKGESLKISISFPVQPTYANDEKFLFAEMSDQRTYAYEVKELIVLEDAGVLTGLEASAVIGRIGNLAHAFLTRLSVWEASRIDESRCGSGSEA